MEFLKVFEDALKLGMTKEEFLPIWELELRRKQVNEGSTSVLQNIDSDRHQQIKDELHQDLYIKLQHMFSDLAEKQELQWKQLWQKNDELWSELRSNFGILSNHISNISETQTSSLKLFLMQEVNLLEQDMKKIIETKNIGQEPLSISQNQASSKNYQDLCDGTNSVYKPQDLIRNHEQTQQLMHLPEPTFDKFVYEQKKTMASKNSHFVTPGSGEVVEKTQDNEYAQSNSKTNLNTDHKSSGKKGSMKNVLPLKSSSSNVSTTDTTKSYAEATAKQIKSASQTTLTQSKLAFTESGLDNSIYKQATKTPNSFSSNISKAGSEINQEQDVIEYIHREWATFIINGAEAFTNSHEEFTTSFYYTRSKVCKIRLRIWFNMYSQLNVFLIVSNGSEDNIGKWPIQFTGSGFIYNESSQAFSQLWALGPHLCCKPEPGMYVMLKAAVSLKTLRSTSPDVTYRTIFDKGYALGDRLIFQWNLDALESFGKGTENPSN